MSNSSFYKTRGKIHAQVMSPKSVEHLDPTSKLHAMHRVYAEKAKAFAAGVVVANIVPPSKLSFPSLSGGKRFDYDCREISSAQFEERLNSLRRMRSHYYREEVSRNGTTYPRKRRVQPVRQFAVTVFPAHSLALSATEQAGIGIAPQLPELLRFLRADLRVDFAYELVGFAVHPEEAVLHIHVIYCVVSQELQLLHEGNQRGQPARNFMRIGAIATKRLVENGLWPQSDLAFVDKRLADLGQNRPIDLILSETVDAFFERYFRSENTRPEVKEAYRKAMEFYAEHAAKLRAMRPDVLAERVDELEAKLKERDAVIAQLNAELRSKHTPPIAMPALLEELTRVLLRIGSGMLLEKRDLPLQQYIVQTHDGLVELSPSLWEVVHEYRATLVSPGKFAELNAALTELNTSVKNVCSILRERSDEHSREK